MYDCLYEDIKVRYYALDDCIDELPDNFDFLIAKTSSEDINRIMDLERKGFVFHNRTLLGEISLLSLNERIIQRIRADVRTDKEFTRDIYELAQRAFTTDRRFHLTKQFDSRLAKKILNGYIDFYKEQNTVLYKCFHREQLIGFTMVRLLDGDYCENVLGAVEPEYQSKGAAFNLYSYMMKCLRDNGLKRLLGRISVTNVASINLHATLGAKYSRPEDDYIFYCKNFKDSLIQY